MDIGSCEPYFSGGPRGPLSGFSTCSMLVRGLRLVAEAADAAQLVAVGIVRVRVTVIVEPGVAHQGFGHDLGEGLIGLHDWPPERHLHPMS